MAKAKKKVVLVMSKRAALSGDGLVVSLCVEAYHEDVKAWERLVRAGLRGAGLKFKTSSPMVKRRPKWNVPVRPPLRKVEFVVAAPSGTSLTIVIGPKDFADTAMLEVSGRGYDYSVRMSRKYTSANLTRNVEKAVAAAVKFIAEDRAWRDRHNRETEECNARREQMKADFPAENGWEYDSFDREMVLTASPAEIGAKLKAGCDGYEVRVLVRGLTVEQVLRLVDVT